MPSPASDEIRAAIAAAGGELRFDRFMELALYGVGGFYTTGGSAGRRGDFITSPEVGPLFGAVLARWLDATWRSLGEPEPFHLIEAGAGPGTLARSILAASPACSVAGALRYTAVEIADDQRSLHPDQVTSRSSMPPAVGDGVIVANELLDNLPFRLFVHDAGWREAYVVVADGERFAEVLQPADDLDALGLPQAAPHGARVPVQQQAGRWIADAVASIERGRVLVVDYAAATTAELASRPWRQWLRTYRSHERGAHYLRDPGTQDITAEIALDQLFRAAGPPDVVRTQSQFLQRWGIDALVEHGRQVWDEHASSPTLEAMRMRSRVREAEALCDHAGLGAFSAVEFVAAGGVETPRNG